MNDDWLFLQYKLIKILFLFTHLSYQIQKCWFGHIKPHRLKGKCNHWWGKEWERGAVEKDLSSCSKGFNPRGAGQGKGADSKSTGLTGSDSGPTGLTDAKTDLTGVPSKSVNASGIKDKKRSSFKELLAKYEKKGAARKQKDPSSKRLRIRNHRQNIKSDQIKVIMSHPMDRLLHGIAGILTFICLWIIVECICNHITFNILLYIQIMLHHKDRLLLEIIWPKKMLIAAKR